MPKSRNKKVNKKPKLDLNTTRIMKQVIKKDMDKVRLEAAEEAIDLSSALIQIYSCITLSDKFGFSKDQLNRFINEILKLSENITYNYTSNIDAIEMYTNELGLEVPEILLRYIESGAISDDSKTL